MFPSSKRDLNMSTPNERESVVDLLLKAVSQLTGNTQAPVEAPIEEEIVIKSFNSAEEGISLESVDGERKCLEVIMEPHTRDAHDNWYTPETIAKGRESYENNKETIPSNLFHLVDTQSFSVEETYILEEDTHFEAIDDVLKKGTWMAWTKYTDDEVWDLKKSGELGGLSPSCLGKVDKETGEITNLAFTKEDFYNQLEESDK